MLRFPIRRSQVLYVTLFLATLAMGYGLRHISHAIPDGLILAAPLGLGWIAPLLWGRRAIVPVLVGSILAALLFSGPPELVIASIVISLVDAGLGYWYSRYRTFPDGLNRFRDVRALAIASAGAAGVRAAIVLAFGVIFGIETPWLYGFAAFGLTWFLNLVFAAVLMVPTGCWRIVWTGPRVVELYANLFLITVLLQYLFETAGPKGINYTFAVAVGLIVVETWLALRFHIRGVGLHRTIWLVLCLVYLIRQGSADQLMPLLRDPIYCGQFALVLSVLLFVEMTVGSMACDRTIEAASNADLAAQLTARNAELERLAAADQSQKAFLDTVLNQMPAGVMIVGRDGSVMWRNHRHRNLWGDTSPQGVSLRDLKSSRISATKDHSVPFESWPIVKAITEGIVTEGFEAKIYSPSRVAIDVSISAAPVHDSTGQLLGAVSILYDMSELKAAMRLLRENEERLRFALNSARMIAYEWSTQTQIIQTSEPFAHWVGLKTAAISSLSDLLKVVHPNDIAGLRGAIGELLHAGLECECEFRIPNDAGMFWVQCRGRRVIDDEGKLTDRVAGILIDVSERRRSEERLRMLESAVVHARDAVVILEAEPNAAPGRCVLYANSAFCEMTGYAAEQLVGRSLHFLRGPDSDPATLDRLRDALDNGESFKGELLNYRRDGSQIWVELSVVPVPDATGPCAHWVMIQRDISDRKQTERVLQRSEAMLADAQRIAHIGSWEYLPQTGECRWSDEKIRIFGQEPLDFAPSVERYLAAIHIDDLEKVQRVGLDAGHLDYPYSLDFRIVRPTGEVRFITEEYYADFDSGGAPTRFWGVTMDNTEKRLAQEQLFQAQKMELIGQMAGGIAHDFNNLLTGIIGNLHLAHLSEDDPNHKHLATALRAANRAADLTQKLLGFARKNQLILHATPVGDIVAEVVSFIARTFDPRIRVAAAIPDEHRVLADPTLISQVLLNLCLNARDAMPQGGRIDIHSDVVTIPEHEVRHPDSRPGEFVRLAIEDTGHGIAPEMLTRVFEPFFTTKPVGQGTGLGLAMVHGIMTQHRGWVEVHSESGRGTRFDLYLPRSAERSARTQLPSHRPAVDARSDTPLPQRKTILLVDDESMIRDIGRVVLESAGFAVIEAEDGEAALDLFRERWREIDLVLLDLTMPKMSGQDTFRGMAGIHPQVRILFSSGYSAENLVGTEGAFGLLPKPYRPQILLDTVRRALSMPDGARSDGSPAPGVADPAFR